MTNTESTPMTNQQLVDEYKDAITYYLSIDSSHPRYRQADKRCLQLEMKAIQLGIEDVLGGIIKESRGRLYLTKDIV